MPKRGRTGILLPRGRQRRLVFGLFQKYRRSGARELEGGMNGGEGRQREVECLRIECRGKGSRGIDAGSGEVWPSTRGVRRRFWRRRRGIVSGGLRWHLDGFEEDVRKLSLP